jgi:hypothetical protein
MEKTFKVTNDKGNDFIVRIVEKGEWWGRNKALLHEKNDPLVVVFDADGEKYELTYSQVAYRQLNPQMVSHYYLSTLLEGDTLNTGINLHGGVPAWQIDKENWRKVIEWLMAYNESIQQLIKEG